MLAALLISAARAALRDEFCGELTPGYFVVIWVSSMKCFLALGFLPLFSQAFRILQHEAAQTSKDGASIPSMDDLQERRFFIHTGIDGSDLCLL